ncbi:MAG: hypothetical protein DHS20C11_06200 [Lysobacteraceae bacterium]|nr:MAG: hypothetical protein DHS20C11_06200 [Xanthomonadaceae bacterium]
MKGNGKAFRLWLEFEVGEPLDQPANRPTQNFCNISVTLPDGRRYAMNVWTFDFLPLARYDWPYEETPDQVPAKYVLPPDLFVERLDRETIECVVAKLLENDEMDGQWLCEDEET